MQQFESLSQGTPSCVQPPAASMQRPGVAEPASTLHRPEQQSAGRVQMSPGAWQVYAGAQVPSWQLREQHSNAPAQDSPSVEHVKPPLSGSFWQVRGVPAAYSEQHWDASATAVPAGLQIVWEHAPPVHVSEQHSPSLAQPWPAGLQKSAVAHVPPTQLPEQHAASAVHAAPSAVQVDGASAHLLFVHVPVQHSVAEAHVAPSTVHWPAGSTHWPDAHWSVQHSDGVEHVWPTGLHVLGSTHAPPEHAPVQHSAGDAQAWPATVHEPSGAQTPAKHVVPAQHSEAAVQAASSPLHAGPSPPLPELQATMIEERAATSSPSRAWLRMQASCTSRRASCHRFGEISIWLRVLPCAAG
ncbi:MAG TPA: hypothetical protein VLC54_16820 [Anaeromyxobacter sp.]|nr:hypothetical protein [Anaeromyxobacter sp.]